LFVCRKTIYGTCAHVVGAFTNAIPAVFRLFVLVHGYGTYDKLANRISIVNSYCADACILRS